MTLDDVAWYPPDAAEVVETPRKHRHVWERAWLKNEPNSTAWGWGHARVTEEMQWPDDLPVLACFRHAEPFLQDPARSRRGKTSRNRGNAFEREVAAKLGGRRVGQYGDQVDVDVPGWLRVQCKNGASYPALLDRWLRAIPVQADLLRAVVVGDAPGPGHQRRSLIVLDLDEFASWYGRKP